MRIAIAGLAIASSIVQAQGPEWVRTDETDALRGTHFVQFTLTGRFLTPPRQTSLENPLMVVQCLPGNHLRVYNGRFLDGYVATGAVLSSKIAQYRLDDGKIQREEWRGSTQGTGAFFSEATLSTFLYGHFLPHKEGTGPPIHKIVLALYEYLGGEIVMQFDMPDPAEMADVCGAIVHKRAR